jgi:TP901 family phage tail tape measure protein
MASKGNGFGVKLGFEFDSFDKVNKEYLQYIQRLSQSGQVKIGMNTKNLDDLKKTFTELSKTNIKIFDSGAYSQIQTLKNSMGELLKVTNNFNNQGDKTSTNYSVSGSKDLENQKTLYRELNNLQQAEYKLKQQLITADGSQYTELNKQLETTRQMQSAVGRAINKTGLTDEKQTNDLLRQRIELTNSLKLVETKNNDDLTLKQRKEELDLINQMANAREKSQARVQKDDNTRELNQAKAINKAKEEAYQQSLKQEAEEFKLNEALKKEQEQVQQLIKNKIELLNIDKQRLIRQYGEKVDTSYIDSAISKLKSMENTNLGTLRNEFRNIDTNIKQITEDAKSSEGALNKINTVLGNVGIYVGVASIVREITQLFKEASEYTLTMDKTLTNIQMITGKSRAEVSGIANEFKNLGSQLHTTNKEMMSGAEETLRAGYSKDDSEKVITASVYGSKISGQDMKTTTDQLIAVKNAFNLTGDSIEHVVDILSKADNTSATSFKELADAIQRTAFSAQEAGTPLENLVSYITTVSEKTRKPAETIGESFKTIYSRFSNIKIGNLDEDGKSINDTETAMRRIGIQIRDSKDQFKQFDEVLQEFMTKFKNGELSQVDYLAGVQALAGTRKQKASYVQKCA